MMDSDTSRSSVSGESNPDSDGNDRPADRPESPSFDANALDADVPDNVLDTNGGGLDLDETVPEDVPEPGTSLLDEDERAFEPTLGSTSAPADTCDVTVRFFGPLRDLIETGEMTLTLDVPATGADLLDALEDTHPAIHEHRRALRLAVNRQYVPTMETLSGGDEVALITPVSGG